MTKVLIFYYSRSGNTEKVIHLVEELVGGKKLDIKSKKG